MGSSLTERVIHLTAIGSSIISKGVIEFQETLVSESSTLILILLAHLTIVLATKGSKWINIGVIPDIAAKTLIHHCFVLLPFNSCFSPKFIIELELPQVQFFLLKS